MSYDALIYTAEWRLLHRSSAILWGITLLFRHKM